MSIQALQTILTQTEDNTEKLNKTHAFLLNLQYKTDQKITKKGINNSDAFLRASIENLLNSVSANFQSELDAEYAKKNAQIAALKADLPGLAEKLAEQKRLKAELDALMEELRK